MRLDGTSLLDSPGVQGWVRLQGTISLDDTDSTEIIWFDVPRAHADALSRTANPFLPVLLPWAMTRGEPLHLTEPVDALLLERAHALMAVWSGWYPERLRPIAITCPADQGDQRPPGETGLLFSGGVDSFHSLLRHLPEGTAICRRRIHALLTIWGFDIPLDAVEAFQRLADRMQRLADDLGMAWIPIASNIRSSLWQETNWGLLGQGPALAAVGHALAGALDHLLIPASIGFGSPRHWGTHPLVDPLLGSSRLSVDDDGALESRMEKLACIVRSPLALGELRVCWMGGDDRNCGRCEKCLRTLTALELLGARDRAVSFPPEAWSLESLASLRYRNELDRRYMTRMAERARAAGRPEIARAIGHATRNYDLRVAGVRILRRFKLRRPGRGPG
jgi:hypothetical protein